MKTISFILLLLPLFLTSVVKGEVQVGSETATDQSLPVEPDYNYSYSENIYLATDLSSTGTITYLKWYFYGSSLSNSNTWTIYLGHTSKTSFNSVSDWINTSAMTEVYNGSFSDPGTSGWITIDITDWNYNGTDNLVVAVDENSSGRNGSNDDFYCSSVSGSRGIYYYSNDINPNPSSPPDGTLTNNIANIIFGGLCKTPSGQNEEYITQTEAKLGWTENGSSTIWDMEFGSEGFTPTGTPTTTGVTTNPYNITGLTANSSYDWYVRSNCGSGEYSSWEGPSTFSTMCNAHTSFPMGESFEVSVPPECWRQKIVSTTGGPDPEWSRISSGSDPSASPIFGSHMAMFNSSICYGGRENRLFTPPLDFSGYHNAVMSFWMYHDYGLSHFGEGVYVQASTDATNWTTVGNFHSRPSSNDGWSKHTVDLSTYDGEATVYIGFLGHGEHAGNVYIDSVRIHNSAPVNATWTGSSGSDWYSSDNWNSSDIPYPVTDITIPPGLTHYPTILTVGAECNNLTIESDNTGTGSLTGQNCLNINDTAYIYRYLTPYTSNDNGWHFLSSPVDKQKIQPEFVENPPASQVDFYYYSETDTALNWINSKTESGNWNSHFDTQFTKGKGYLVAYPSAVTKVFTGLLNKEDVPRILTYTSNSPGMGWNLMGNPFPSALDWDSIEKTDFVDGTVYVFDASTNTYLSWNGSTGSLSDGIIPSMQGFFVHCTAKYQTFTMALADQVNNSSVFHKTSQNLPVNTLRLSVQKDNYSNSLFVQLREDATKDFDHAIDGYKLFGMTVNPEIFAKDDNQIYSIDCLPDTLGKYDLQIGLTSGVSGSYNLMFDGVDEIIKNHSLKLEDLKTHEMINLTSDSSYPFVCSAGDNDVRFILHFGTPSAIDENKNNNDQIVVYSYHKKIVVEAFDNNPVSGTLQVKNVLNQNVSTKSFKAISRFELQTDLTTGIYFIRIYLSDGSSFTKKVFIR